jgi:hypothetical protein
MAGLQHPVTPDGRYFVVRGRLWRMADPDLDPDRKLELVRDLMQARRAVQEAKSSGDFAAEAAAHNAVDVAKRALGERGPVWWKDGSPDLNRHMAKNSPYMSLACRTFTRKARPEAGLDVFGLASGGGWWRLAAICTKPRMEIERPSEFSMTKPCHVR